MIILGLMFMSRISVDMYPDVNFPFVSVSTFYSGAGPKEMETLVSKILEEEMTSLSGLKNVTSISQDGLSTVIAEFTLETESRYAEQQVKDKVAQARYKLPKEIDEPIVRRFDPSDAPIMMISLTADLSPTELYDLADTTIKTAFSQVKDVGAVEILGGMKREIHVNLELDKLKDYEISVTQASDHIGANSQNIPIGKVNQSRRELSFRSLGEFSSIQQIKDVVVSFFGSDVPITVEKIGSVSDGNEEVKTRAYLNGKEALILEIYKQSDTNTVEIADSLIRKTEKMNALLSKMKGAPKLSVVRDESIPIKNNIKDVRTTIFEGILLAILVVYLFLGSYRSTFITVIALPNSLIGAFIFMGAADFSINVLTLMALSLSVGLLIDDAIVVRENIFRHMEHGMSPKEAAEKGTREVTLAVMATTLTVIAVFLPVGFLQGMVGQFFKQFGFTVVFAMIISFFDALTTAPMLSAYMISKVHASSYRGVAFLVHLPAWLFGKFQDGLEWFYEKLIRFTLKHKIFILFSAVVVFVESILLLPGIPKTFMPANEFGEFMVNLESAPGTSLSEMNRYTLEIESLIRKEKDVDYILSIAGNNEGESNRASLFVKMVPFDQRRRSTTQMKDYIRKMLLSYKNDLRVNVDDIQLGGGEDKPFMLLIMGQDLDQISRVASELKTRMEKIRGLVDLDTNYRQGKPEFQIRMDPLKMEKVGVLSTTAGNELRAMVDGVVPAKFREQGFEYDIRVRLKEEERDLTKAFSRLYVPNVNQQLVKLINIADPSETTGPSKVYRRNRGRYVLISANLAAGGATGTVTEEAKKIIEEYKLPDGVSYEFIGESEDMVDLFKNMLIAALLSVIFIYLVLASLYESLLLPFTIMLALPLAIVGGFLALFLTGESINIFSMIGFIMLLGVVTKNSILLVDYAQKLIRKGFAHKEAIIKAGLIRLRPILMTTVALIAGMIPIALGLSEEGRFRKSMGIAIIGGLISSTFLTLVVVPAVFEFMDKLRRRLRKFMGRPELREIDKDTGDDLVED